MTGSSAGGLRHVVCLTWAPGTDAAAIAAVCEGLTGLPGAIAEIRSFAFGADLGLVEANADFAIVAEFEDDESWRRYQEHPDHVRVITELIRPHLGARTAVQVRIAALETP